MYNGWTNWETWNVNVWLNNDPTTYHQGRFYANSDSQDAFEQWAREHIESAIKDTSSCAMDLVRAGLDEVNFEEIYDGFKEE